MAGETVGNEQSSELSPQPILILWSLKASLMQAFSPVSENKRQTDRSQTDTHSCKASDEGVRGCLLLLRDAGYSPEEGGEGTNTSYSIYI